jgi:uncharacterized membrane protein
MSNSISTPTSKAWELIDQEKRREQFLRRASRAAWTVTFIIAGLFAVLTGLSVAEMVRGAMMGALPWMTALGVAMPFLTVILTISVLVAALSTVGIFLRLRTATLTEIQLRLAALEEMLATRPEPGTPGPSAG